MWKEKYIIEATKLVALIQATFEAKRGAQAGTVKPDDAVRIHNEESNCRAKADYIRERLNGFVQHG